LEKYTDSRENAFLDGQGNPDATTQFPQETVIDYVRVYQAVRP
jgi:hypothetical protein